MVKAMWVVKGKGHIVGSVTNRFTSFSFHKNQSWYSWNIAIDLFHNIFPLADSSPNTVNKLISYNNQLPIV